MSIQKVKNKFMSTFNTSITNIKNVDWDQIQDTSNKLVLENNNKLWMKIFLNQDDNNYLKTNTKFVSNIIKPNVHGVEKYDILKKFHVNPKTNNSNQFLVDSLQLMKDEIHSYSIV
jgi:hypothetical protein